MSNKLCPTNYVQQTLVCREHSHRVFRESPRQTEVYRTRRERIFRALSSKQHSSKLGRTNRGNQLLLSKYYNLLTRNGGRKCTDLVLAFASGSEQVRLLVLQGGKKLGGFVEVAAKLCIREPRGHAYKLGTL